MITAAQLLADQAWWFADLPSETITIGSTDYSVKVPRADDRNDWDFGGRKDESTLNVIFDRNSAPDPSDIVPGTVVGFRSGRWRVMVVRHDFPQSPLMVELRNARMAETVDNPFLTADSGETVDSA